MDPEIKIIEDLSLNAWPSHQVQVYDGWILRFSHLYTYRTNCIEEIGLSLLPYEEKIPYCEEIYRRWQTPCIYKVSPVTDPDLDVLLAARGYERKNPTDVMTRRLADASPVEASAPFPVHLENRVTYQWLEGLFQLKNTTDLIHRRIVPAMYDAIPKDEIAAFAADGERVIATGLGILDRDYIGIYAIHVAPEYRRMGLARSICSTLLAEGRKKGAVRAYLQVLSDNEPALALYRSLGFTRRYSYAFRLRELC